MYRACSLRAFCLQDQRKDRSWDHRRPPKSRSPVVERPRQQPGQKLRASRGLLHLVCNLTHATTSAPQTLIGTLNPIPMIYLAASRGLGDSCPWPFVRGAASPCGAQQLVHSREEPS